jgi:hypothetical protein
VAFLLRDVDDVTRHRRSVDDDTSPFLPDHRPGRRLGREKDTIHVGVLKPIPLEAPVTTAFLPSRRNKSNTLMGMNYLPGSYRPEP